MINKLKSNISMLERRISSLEEKYKINPNNFAVELELNSFNEHLKELQGQLRSELIKREREIIELRLIGPQANFGSIPLKFVGGITNSFAAAIFDAYKFAKFGHKGGVKKDQIVNEDIDLRLEGIGQGSTVLFISGKTTPDVFGHSIIEKTLENAFTIFHAGSQEEIIENIGKIGSKSIKNISKFLDELEKDNLEVDLNWRTPEEKTYKWEGRKENIQSLYNYINDITISNPERITFEGELITISKKGKFELKESLGQNIIGNFPRELLEDMKEYHIGDACKMVISRTSIFNPINNTEKFEYLLRSIKPL